MATNKQTEKTGPVVIYGSYGRDKNGKRIFEGDIVQYAVIVRGTCLYIANLKIVFNRSAFCLEDTKTGHTHTLYNHEGESTLEVIGNIHDNPELIREG